MENRLEDGVSEMKVDLYHIKILELEINCIIGFLPFERENPQRLFFDVSLEVRNALNLDNDEIGHTIDYVEIADLIQKTAKDGRYNLVETCVIAVARKIQQKYPPVAKIKLEARKPGAIASATCAAVELNIAT